MSKATLRFTEIELQMGQACESSPLPDLLPGFNFQNKNHFDLDESDEIYQGYGQLPTAFPYPALINYGRSLASGLVKAAILENEFLYAVFLPEYGGRLWQLLDKRSGRDLLFTNDVLRFSNLAVRDAWFAGGVEWNVGVIGHTPLTSAPVFAASTSTDDGEPVLRLYAYERIRKVTYQMDFWLEPSRAALNAYFCIANPNDALVPMYWWSNMAVPEYEGGRIVLPAHEAYTAEGSRVYKCEIPVVNGVDVSYYGQIPGQVDYFFKIPEAAPKFIAAVDGSGFGLLHLSSARLQSRKLFSWGSNEGSARWQSFLSEKAGRYVEIQAGLGKTQYGCVPMAPQTVWEWTEQYAPLALSADDLALDFVSLSSQLSASLDVDARADLLMEKAASFKKSVAVLQWSGNADAALENARRAYYGLGELRSHLDFSSADDSASLWFSLLRDGVLDEVSGDQAPGYFVADSSWISLLHLVADSGSGAGLASGADSDSDSGLGNWFLRYHLGLLYLNQGRYKAAKKQLKLSLRFERNAWNLHAYAACCVWRGRLAKARKLIFEGALLRLSDLAYAKEALRILARCSAFSESLDLIGRFSLSIQSDARILFYKAAASYELGAYEEALAILEADGGLVVADVREGDLAIGELWKKIQIALGASWEIAVPAVFNFDAFV